MTKRFFAASAMWLALAGCSASSGPQIVAVRGTVTLDGEPVENAIVEFVPQTGRPASSATDELGQYDLAYTDSIKGAVTGTHLVKISTGRELVTQEGAVVQQAVPETIPARYNSQSELTAEVVPENAVIDFEM